MQPLNHEPEKPQHHGEHLLRNKSLPQSQRGLFASLPPAPEDRSETFAADRHPHKTDLRMGIYRNEEGVTARMRVVQFVMERGLPAGRRAEYLPMAGDKLFHQAVQDLLFGSDHPALAERRVVTVQSIGATSGLRCGAEFLRRYVGSATAVLSTPTWGDHERILAHAGLKVGCYPYYDERSRALDWPGFLKCLSQLEPGSVVMLQASCHNPTGLDPTREQWKELADVIERKELLPFVDLPYQGFADGVEEDVWFIRELASRGQEFLVTNSFCKNFSLYDARPGALSVVARDADTARTVLAHIKAELRSLTASPPAEGALIVQTVLGDPVLRKAWESELGDMRQRLCDVRQEFLQRLRDKGVGERFEHIARQTGLFAYTGLSRTETKCLRERHGVYLLSNGRICVAALNAGNMEYVVEAIGQVCR